MINDWHTTLRLRSTSHTQSYFYIKYRKHIKNFKSNINSIDKKFYIQNKSKNDHLDFLSLTVQIVKSRLQNRQLNLFKIS